MREVRAAGQSVIAGEGEGLSRSGGEEADSARPSEYQHDAAEEGSGGGGAGTRKKDVHVREAKEAGGRVESGDW